MEQVVDAAPGVGALLASSPALKVLVTSRAPLHLSGEQEYEVEPLSEPAAVELFVDRARSVRADFEVDGQRDAIAELCVRLDRLPLAIELAGGTDEAPPPGDAAARLQERLPLLVGGPRDCPERQRTLEATIDWSYNLLDDDERTLFRRLAVFVDGWDSTPPSPFAGRTSSPCWNRSSTTACPLGRPSRRAAIRDARDDP